MQRKYLLSAMLLAVGGLAALVSVTVTKMAGEPSKRPVMDRCYRAAVFDHVQQVKYLDPALRQKNVELNLDVYEEAAKKANEEKANIIVFPENGLVFNLKTNQEALEFGENLTIGETYCDQSKYAKSHPISSRLSCMAKKNNLYLAADMIDKVACQIAQDPKCPKVKSYVFNTAVLFNPNGQVLAKYHKMQPFGEMYLNVPPKDELVVVSTELGRLSMQICFDMIYQKPGEYLASRQDVDTILFPTWWFDELPFLGGAQFQAAWAFGNKVNVLASNIHKIEVGSKGSGIYIGSQQSFIALNYEDHQSRLLVANVPRQADGKAICDANPKTIVIEQKVPSKSDASYKWQSMNMSEVDVITLANDTTSTKASSCHRGVCCSVEVTFDRNKIDQCNVHEMFDSEIDRESGSTSKWEALTKAFFFLATDESYHLLVSNRTRPGQYPWSEEMCALVYCLPEQNPPCKQVRTSKELATRFQTIRLTAEVGENTKVYPSVVGSRHRLIEPDAGRNWRLLVNNDDNGSNKGKRTYQLVVEPKQGRGSLSISTVALYGRAYERDPPYEQKPTQL